MSMQTIKCFLFMQERYTDDYRAKEWKPELWTIKVDDSQSRVYIRDIEVQVDAPDDFAPVPKQVAALQSEREKIIAKFTKELEANSDALAKLLSITNEVTECPLCT